ncbi:MAG: hypothetical protein A2734_02785 [Parcubacteria group bacterium RIFCSPHIGHO2_01_FULL_40_30]|nr:MAG: hypothetical protein A2734_02785 [Parcubacteria group bacterium RIFCSPHIGHO2_01_FULL_40_30]
MFLFSLPLIPPFQFLAVALGDRADTFAVPTLSGRPSGLSKGESSMLSRILNFALTYFTEKTIEKE